MEIKVFDLMLSRMNYAIENLIEFQKKVLDEQQAEDKESQKNN